MNTRTLIQRYDAAAPFWTEKMTALGYAAAYTSFARAALERVPVPARLCDVGCGSGSFAQAVVRAIGPAPWVTLVDPSPQMLRLAAARIGPIAAGLDQWPVPLHLMQGQFDMVLAAHVIEHCPDPAAALADLARLLRPGGALLLVASRPHWCQWLIWLLWRHRWFGAAQIVGWATQAGFDHLLTYPFAAGPPRRTSLGHVFLRSPDIKDPSCLSLS